MFAKKLLVAAVAILAAQSAFAAASDLLVPDSVSADYGTSAKVRMERLSVQEDWNVHWFESNGTHLDGYFDLTAGTWQEKQTKTFPVPSGTCGISASIQCSAGKMSARRGFTTKAASACTACPICTTTIPIACRPCSSSATTSASAMFSTTTGKLAPRSSTSRTAAIASLTPASTSST